MILFLFLAFKDVNVSQAFYKISKISFTYLIVFIAVFFISHVLRALRWKVILSSVKSDIKIKNLFGSTMIGYGVNCIVPRLGEIYRPSFLGKLEGLSRTAMFATIIVERVIDILFLGISVLVSISIYNGNLYAKFSWLNDSLWVGMLLMVFLILIILFVIKFKDKCKKLILSPLTKISPRIAQRFEDIFHQLVEGFATIKTKKQFFSVLLLTILIMLIYGLNSWIGFYMIGLHEFKSVSFEMAWVVMTISAFGIVIPTPGGTGSYHFLVIAALSLYGVSSTLSAAYAVLTHLISTILFIGSTFASVYFLNRSLPEKEKVNFINVFKMRTKN